MRTLLDNSAIYPGDPFAVPVSAQLAHAINCSRIRDLCNLPYPVQFRNQDALPAWREAMKNLPSWAFWNDPGTACEDMRTDMEWHFDRAARTLGDPALVQNWQQGTRLAPLECSTNLLYALRKGTLIEATPELELLLLNSDIDRALPLSMLALPYSAQYIRFGEAVGKAASLPDSPNPDNALDGVFCFHTPPSPGPHGFPAPRLEFVFIAKAGGRFLGHVMLLGTIGDKELPVMEWLSRILSRHRAVVTASNCAAIGCALDYVAKLLLYLGLKQARVADRNDHGQALARLVGMGTKKRGRYGHRLARYYDRVEVGPERLNSPGTAEPGGALAPHWRRGHFRLQPCGQGWKDRKMIYIAPVLVHARGFAEAPQPKSYRVAHA